MNKSLISLCTGPAAVSSNFPYSSFHVLSVCVILLCFYLEKFYHIYYNWSCKVQIQVSKVQTFSWLPVITIKDFTICIFTLDFLMFHVAFSSPLITFTIFSGFVFHMFHNQTLIYCLILAFTSFACSSLNVSTKL